MVYMARFCASLAFLRLSHRILCRIANSGRSYLDYLLGDRFREGSLLSTSLSERKAWSKRGSESRFHQPLTRCLQPAA